ncbi:MAG TPA: NADH-quinone oxidoreductase subunit N [Limnochordia bacterium]|nr:NADH-quinone oxidoreductase subunit N [Limnochordia bacterium]
MNYWLLAPEIILTIAGLVLTVAATGGASARALAAVTAVADLAALATLPWLWSQGPTELWDGLFVVDGLAVFFAALLLTIATLLALLSPAYLERFGLRAGEFFTLVTFAVLGGLVLSASRDLITIYLGLELMALSSYPLAGLMRRDARSGEAAIKFFLIGAVSSAVLLFGLSLLFGFTGSTHLPAISAALSTQPALAAPIAAAMIFVVAGLMFKIAIAPFHLWAPDVYEGAPTPVTAFLITASEAAGFAAVLRLFGDGLGPLAGSWGTLLAVLAVLSMLYGNLAALSQSRAKRIMAYSAIAQAGYVLAGVALGNESGLSAALYYLFVYALMTLGTFAFIAWVEVRSGTDALTAFDNLAARAPAAAFFFSVALIALIGIPFTAGFFGKLLLFRAAVGAGWSWLAVMMLLNSVLAAPYYLRFIRHMYFPATAPEAGAARAVVPGGIAWTLLIALVGIVLLGAIPQPFLGWIEAVRLLP